jgi:hypothetical protein
VGVNFTLTVQVLPVASMPVPPLQVLVCAKSPVAAPTEMVVVAVPVFFTVTTLAALVVPITCAAKVSVAGVSVMVTGLDPEPPVPVRLTVCGEFVAWSVIAMEPVRVPVTVGVNVTFTVQLPLVAASEPVQLFV